MDKILKAAELASFLVYHCDPDCQWLFRALLANLVRE